MNESIRIAIAGLALLVMAGCGPASVQTVGPASGARLPKPDRILVYDFAVTPEEVKLDTGISAEVQQLVQQHQGTSRTAEEIKIGHAVAAAVAAELVKELQNYGFWVQRELGLPTGPGKILLIKGQFVSIDEGNRTERVLIGFGTGRTSVTAHVQLYEITPEGKRLVEKLQADAKSGYKPGMGVMMGVGGIAGHLLTSAVVSGVMTGASEFKFGTVEADGQKMAKQIAKNLGQFFVTQGWILSY
jgi:hypothetical protein